MSHVVRITLTLLLCLVCFPTQRAFGKSEDDAARFEQLERVVQEELAETHTPGAAVAVIKGGRVIFAKGFGTGNVETNAPITADTLFRLGSTTKMFTGAAAVVLAERGRLKLDAPIGKYVKGLAPKISQLNMHSLLSHTAGVADFGPQLVSNDDSSLATMTRAWKDDETLFGEPGKVYSYSSPGYWLAGYVIEEAGGKPYSDVMDELLFKPLGMKRTTFRPLVAMTHPLALGHSLSKEGKPEIIRPAYNNVAQWPAGSIFSNLNDLSRFVRALFANGNLDGQQVIPAALFTKISGEHTSMPGAPEVHYGYGLLNFAERGVQIVMHGGFSRGYGSMLQMVPEQGFAVIVLTNKSGETLRKTTEKAKELFLTRRKPAEAEEVKKASRLLAEDLARFSGKFVNGPQTWEIVARDGRLYLKNEGEEVALQKTGDLRLSFGDSLENDVVFVPGAGGQLEYIFTGLYSARRSSQ